MRDSGERASPYTFFPSIRLSSLDTDARCQALPRNVGTPLNQRTVTALDKRVRLHSPFGVYHAHTRNLHRAGRCRRGTFGACRRLAGKPALEPGSPPDCKQADVSHLLFDLADTGNELSVKTSSGGAFSAPIGPDGSVRTTFKLPVGAKSFSVDLIGNAKTREMEAFNKQYSCRFKLTLLQ